MIGLATATHSATGTRPPSRRVSSGSAQTSSRRPGSRARRISRTAAIMFSPTAAATALAIRMNSGPYGAGVSCQKKWTLSVSGPGIASGPTAYGSRPASGSAPCAR